MAKQTSNFVYRKNISNQPLAGLSDTPTGENKITDYYKDDPLYGGMPFPVAMGLNLGLKVVGAVTTVWIGSKILGYDH